MFTAIGASTGIFLAQIKLSSIFTDLFMDMIPVMEIIMPQASTGKFFYIDILLYFKRRLLHHFFDGALHLCSASDCILSHCTEFSFTA